MNKRELNYHLKHLLSWGSLDNAKAVRAFTRRMRNRRYDFILCNQAWEFFIDGWKSAKIQRYTLTISDVGVSKPRVNVTRSALVAGGEPVSLDRMLLTEDRPIRMRKGGHNPAQSQITKRPAAPASMQPHLICRWCETDCSNRHAFCYRASGVWCHACFAKTSCGKGEHGEGCGTSVFLDDPHRPAVSASGDSNG